MTYILASILLLLRIVVGFFFFASGWRKTFNPEVHAKIGNFMGRLGVGHPNFVWLICIAELLGGLALLIGFLTPVAALGLIIIMFGAITLTCWPKVCAKEPKSILQWWTALCMEPEVLLVAILAVLVIGGGGLFSIDHYLF